MIKNFRKYDEIVRYFAVDTMERGRIVFTDENAEEEIIYKKWKPGRIAVGVLLVDVVDLDLTKQSLNYFEKVQVGCMANILTVGTIFTDFCQSVENAYSKLYPNRSGKFVSIHNKEIINHPIAAYTGRKDGEFRELKVNMYGV